MQLFCSNLEAWLLGRLLGGLLGTSYIHMITVRITCDINGTNHPSHPEVMLMPVCVRQVQCTWRDTVQAQVVSKQDCGA